MEIRKGNKITREQLEEQGYIFSCSFAGDSEVFKSEKNYSILTLIYWNRNTQEIWAIVSILSDGFKPSES